ncbi:MAG TPA: oligosaccharide flippase family protein [Bacteroidales bacterium]|nr:oligosaccharide flippase family protein [Bacteroidales bacterium]
MEFKKLLKNTSFLVFSKGIQFFIGILRSKVAAVYIGTLGVGIFSQISYLVTMISNVTLLSMNDGLVKQIVQNKNNNNYKNILVELIKSYSVLISITTTVIIIFCLVFTEKLTIFFLGSSEYKLYYLLGITCIPITIGNSLSYAVLKSNKDTILISRSNILSSLLTIIFFLPLIYFFKTTGAVISVLLNFFFLLIINHLQVNRLFYRKLQIKYRDIAFAKIHKPYLKEFLTFAIFGATAGIISLISESVCRSIVISQIGIQKLGIYSPITSWSNLLIGFILPSLSTYLYPRFSECKNNVEIKGILNDSIRMVTLLMIPFLFIAMPFRKIIIPLFYSNDFLEAEKYLSIHFIGVLFYMWWYAFSQSLTPRGNIIIHGILITLMSILNVVIVLLFVPKLGLYGWMLKFLISPFIFFIIYFIVLKYLYGFNIYRKNLLIMLYVLLSALIIIIIDNYSFKYFMSPIMILASIVFLSKSEKLFLLNFYKKFTYHK